MFDEESRKKRQKEFADKSKLMQGLKNQVNGAAEEEGGAIKDALEWRKKNKDKVTANRESRSIFGG